MTTENNYIYKNSLSYYQLQLNLISAGIKFKCIVILNSTCYIKNPFHRTAEDTISLANHFCTMQGSVRRKTILKEGRKPTVASWQRYWIQIWASSLAYFSPKSFKG